MQLYWQILRFVIWFPINVNDHFFITWKIYHSHDDVTFIGVCTKQTCSLTSGEQDLLAGVSLRYYSTSMKLSFFTFYLNQKNGSICNLDISLGHIAILIIFRVIVQPYIIRISEMCNCQGATDADYVLFAHMCIRFKPVGVWSY